MIIISSGYFDPIHIGHLEHLSLARKLGDKLIVILNNDKQAVLKKGKFFMPENERKKILESLKSVDEVFTSIDEDRTVCKSIEYLAKKYHDEKIVFVKGGDRKIKEIPEKDICEKYKIKIIDGIGTSYLNVHSSVLTGIREIKQSSNLIKNGS